MGMKYVWTAALVIVVAITLLTRFISLDQPYHHDEYKWVLASDPASGMPAETIPHPFFGRFVYHHLGELAGYDNVRIVPILFSLITLTLMFLYVRRRYSLEAAILVCASYVISFYALLASVQIDIDGTFLPLALMLVVWGIEYAKTSSTSGYTSIALGTLIGIFTKLSFALVPITIAADYALRSPDMLRKLFRKEVIFGGVAAIALAALAAIVLWDQVLFIHNIGNFAAIHGRDFGQLAFLTAKVLIYLSPLIPLGILLGLRQMRELSFWYVFLAVNAIFYYVLFDFSHRTLDRYLEFVLVPGSIITGVVLWTLVAQIRWSRSVVFIGTAAAIAAIALTRYVWTLTHAVFPLIPKQQFVDAFSNLSWNFLVPLTGGSGPLGFYVPLDWVAIMFALSAAAFAVAYIKKSAYALAIFIALITTYNGALFFEYSKGSSFGSTVQVAHALTDEIVASTTIPAVITYNDIGAYELFRGEKYEARFYPHTQFIPDNIEKFKRGTGYYLVIDMPTIHPDSGYARFFNQCISLVSTSSGIVTGNIYDCREVDPESIAEN